MASQARPAGIESAAGPRPLDVGAPPDLSPILDVRRPVDKAPGRALDQSQSQAVQDRIECQEVHAIASERNVSCSPANPAQIVWCQIVIAPSDQQEMDDGMVLLEDTPEGGARFGLTIEPPCPVQKLRSTMFEAGRPWLHFAWRCRAQHTVRVRIFELDQEKCIRHRIASRRVASKIPHDAELCRDPIWPGNVAVKKTEGSDQLTVRLKERSYVFSLPQMGGGSKNSLEFAKLLGQLHSVQSDRIETFQTAAPGSAFKLSIWLFLMISTTLMVCRSTKRNTLTSRETLYDDSG